MTSGKDPLKVMWGQQIKRQRLHKGMTQEQLAQALDIDQAAVSRWETGDQAPSLASQHALVRVLGVDLRLLLPLEAGAAS